MTAVTICRKNNAHQIKLNQAVLAKLTGDDITTLNHAVDVYGFLLSVNGVTHTFSEWIAQIEKYYSMDNARIRVIVNTLKKIASFA